MAAPLKTRSWSWRSKAFRGVLYQVVVLALILAAGGYLLHNTLENMRVRGIQSGFDFITEPAGFGIGESIVPFDSSESYGKAFLVGLSNTFRVAILGIVLSTVLGTLVGVGRLSRNFLVRTLSGAYVDLLRNVPLLLQLFIWYFVLTEFLPPIESALQPLPGTFFSKNGLQYALPLWVPGHWATLGGFGVGLLGAWAWARWVRARREATGRAPMFLLPALAVVAAATALGWLLGVFQMLLVAGIIPETLEPCTQGVPCSETVIEWFGFLTIPLLSVLAFSVIIALLALARIRGSR